MPSDLVNTHGKPVTGRYSAEEREIALRLLATNGGNIQRTSQQLAHTGRAVDETALKHWRDVQHARRYAELCVEVAHDVAANTAGEAMEIAADASKAEREYIAAAQRKIDEVPARDLAKAAQALASAKMTNVQSARLLREQPTQIQETRDIATLVGILQREGVLKKAPTPDEEENAPDMSGFVQSDGTEAPDMSGSRPPAPSGE